ncbi:MAG: hypothetical protein MI923_19815 [Phycisphaerales bacterium]|nr:hypothetical protein [Phycisphaerales bacterium]
MKTNLGTCDNPHDALLDLGSDFFGPDLVDATLMPPDQVPSPFDGLLVHNEHMTTSLQRYHGLPVELEVLEERTNQDLYHRKILLTVQGTDHVVEVGVARINLGCTSDDVRAEIQKRETPLGDILIRHNVMRRIEPRWFFRFERPGPLIAAFDRPIDGPVYGRVGMIYFDEEPAIELLEVVAPDKAL